MLKQWFFFIVSLLSTRQVNSVVMVALKQFNTEQIFHALEEVSDPNSPTYGEYWTQEKIDITVSPPKEEILSLMNYLEYQEGITCEWMSSALKCSDVPNLKNIRMFTDIVEFVEEPYRRDMCFTRHYGKRIR